MTPTETNTMITVAKALMSGVTPRRTFEKISIGSVVAPGPDTKLAITTSSSESVKASNQPAPESDQFLSVPQDKRWTVRFTVTF